MRLRYDTGSAFGFVRGGAIVVLPEGATSDLVRTLWDGIDAAGDGDVEVIEVIQLLTVALGATLRNMPPFAVAVVSGRRVQVAVRGEVSVTLDTATDRIHVDGDDVSTWSERLLEEVETLSVQLGVDEASDLAAGPGQVSLAGLPLTGGVVLMSRIVRDLVAAPASVRDAADDSLVVAVPVLASVPVQAPVPAPPAADLHDAPSGNAFGASAGGRFARGDVAPLAPASSSGELSPPGMPVSYETIAPESTITPEVPGTPETTDEPEETEVFSAPADVVGPAPSDVAEGGPAELLGDGYGHLWESTVLRTVEDAAIRVEEPDEDNPAEGGVLAHPVRDGGAPAPLDVPSTDNGSPMIDGIPREWTGATPAAVGRARAVERENREAALAAQDAPARATAPEQEADDHDGHTVFSSVVADLRAQVGGRAPLASPPTEEFAAVSAPLLAPGAPSPAGPAFSPPPPPGAQQILARVCADGHPNPASRDVCGHCGVPLLGDARLVTRPALGRLTLSNGQVVVLDRPVVLGRRPRSTRAQSNDLPRLVAVPSPEQDISRSHVEIQLEGWHVLVCDLNTTNGTTLLRPGQPPRRLHPGEPMMVASRDVVDVGDGVTFVFEDLL